MLHTIFREHIRLIMKEEEYLLIDAVTLENQSQAAAATDAAFRSERKRLFNFIRRRVRIEADAEDILADVFYQLVESYSVTEPIEKMTSWLLTVARNKIIDWYRKRKPESFQQREDESALPLNLEDILFDPSQNPDLLYERSLLWTEFADALEELPDEQRDVFVMHELEGRSFKEIAEITGEPVNTLLSRKRYAVLYLREALQELYDDFYN
jgi:RNA polymerase sigma factor (sigma-70 family)